MGQTPCYIETTPLPTPSTLGDFQSSLISAIQSTASAGASPSVTVAVVTAQVFALGLTHKPSDSGLSVGARAVIGVGAALGGIMFLLGGCWAFLFTRRRRRKQKESGASASGGAPGNSSIAGIDPFVDSTAAGSVSPYQPSHSSHPGPMTQTTYPQYGAQTYYPPPPSPGSYNRDPAMYYHPTGSPSPPAAVQQPYYQDHGRELSGAGPDAQMLHGSTSYPNEMSSTPSPGYQY
jgi:hypothetical protein